MKTLEVAHFGFLFMLALPASLSAQANVFPPVGDVGIGTKTPHAPLEIGSGFDTEVLRFGHSITDYHNISTGFHGSIPSNNYLGFNVEFTSKEIRRVFTLRGDGHVGIGTTSPQENLSVNQGVNIDQSDDNNGVLDHGLKFGETVSGEGIASKRTSGGNQWGLDLYTNHFPRLSIVNDGKVGIGTRTPSRALEVHSAGDVEIGLMSDDVAGLLWTIQSSRVGGPFGQTFQIIDRTNNLSRLLIYPDGTVSVGVLKITGGSDIAEPFDMSTKNILKGSVVVIDEKHVGALMRSQHAYDNHVAGIVSGANGIEPGLSLSQRGSNDGGDNVALSGRAYALADATRTPIKPGDLLTTSDVPGHCMKVTDYAKAQGAIIGKAMSSLEGRRGMVLVLVTLQ